MTDTHRAHVIVDAMNVIGSRPDGWWRNRDRATRTLVARLADYAASTDIGITVVIDGRPLQDLPEGHHDGIEVLYAARPGPNAADDRIIEFVTNHADPASLEVVTSDRTLAARARALRARTSSPHRLLSALDDFERAAP